MVCFQYFLCLYLTRDSFSGLPLSYAIILLNFKTFRNEWLWNTYDIDKGLWSHFLSQSSQNPWILWNDKCLCMLINGWQLGILSSNRVGLVTKGTKVWLKGWNFQTFLGLEVDLIINDQWFNQSFLCNKASIKNPKWRNLERVWVGEHMEILGEWQAWRGHRSSATLPHTLPYASFSLAVPELYLFIMNG